MNVWVVDSFTDTAFSGNPAGVCMPAAGLDDVRLQLIARELGHSETAFLDPLDADGSYAIRYFSPLMEVPLCGHATLAAARTLYEQGAEGTLTFRTVQGLELQVSQRVDGQIAMTFPRYALVPGQASEQLVNALGLDDVEEIWLNPDLNIVMLVIADSATLAGLGPAEANLLACPDDIYGVLVTAPSFDGRHDFHSRFFWPWSGGLEDPVTGGTHTFLAPYWASRLNMTSLHSWQASARGGEMQIHLDNTETLTICGHATIVLSGTLMNA